MVCAITLHLNENRHIRSCARTSSLHHTESQPMIIIDRNKLDEEVSLVTDAFGDLISYGLDNFQGICIGTAFLYGGIYLAITTAFG